MLIVALTGGIASGKSVVAEVFLRHGCAVQSADDVAHELMEPGRPAWEKAVAHFGPEILNPDRTINRTALGKIVFENHVERHFLDDLVHPLVLEVQQATIAGLEAEGRARIFVSEAALTIEAGFAEFFDKIVVTYCPEELQILRLMERDGTGREDALSRIRSQMPAEEKLTYADYVIDTSGGLADTIEEAEEVYEELLLDFRLKEQFLKNV